MNAMIRIFFFVALIESVYLLPISLEDVAKSVQEPVSTTTRSTPLTTDTFIPIAELLNVIAGIQDQLPPLRVKVASFPVSDSSVTPQSIVEPVQETSTPAPPAPVEVSSLASTIAVTPAPVEVTTTIVTVVPEVVTNVPVAPVISIVSTLPETSTVVAPVQDVFTGVVPVVTSAPVLPETTLTPQVVSVELTTAPAFIPVSTQTVSEPSAVGSVPKL